MPILSVWHHEPACDLDSGWVMTCGREHADEELMVVGIGEVVEIDPSVATVLDLPERQWARREDPGQTWHRQWF